MDEPTNHLDLDARNWLEEFLISYPDAVVLVSHDRFFLDAVATAIVEIGLKSLTNYQGGYSHYLVERDARLERLREQKRRQDEEVARMQAFINRFRYQATKAAQVQSRVKMLAKITPIDIPPERMNVHFTFPSCPRSGRTVVELRDVHKSYGTLIVFARANVLVERGDRVALVGPNGAGKSTLMRMLSGVESPDTGERVEGPNVVRAVLRAGRSHPAGRLAERLRDPVLRVARQHGPRHSHDPRGIPLHGRRCSQAREGLVGRRTHEAGGGPHASTPLEHAAPRRADQPPRHRLDQRLLDALLDYGGTLIFVSHDRYFVDRLATKVIEIGSGEAVVYPGTYEDFRWSKQQRARPANPDPPVKSRPPKRPVRAQTPRRPSHSVTHRQTQAETRRHQRRLKALSDRIAELEQRISEREETVQKLEAEMAQPLFYQDEAEAQRTIARHQSLMWEVGDLMNQWEALHAQAGELKEAGIES